jgi:tetratricopeptide (TPR) repeat protein
LLTPGEQAVLAALSVFPTTFTADAAAEIAQATPFDLDMLGEKSLLQQQHEPERYGLHSLVRQFAAAKLAEYTPELNRAFVRYFYQFAREHRADYAALQPEWRNFAAAITKAHTLAEWQSLLNLVQVLDEPWFRQIRFNEMREGLTLALDAAAALPDDLTLARLLLRLGEVEMELNAYAAATDHLAAAMQKLTRWEDSLGIAQAEYLYGRILSEQGRDEEALVQFEASKRIFAEEQDGLGVAKNLNLIAVYHFKQNRDFQKAQTCLEQALALQRPLPVSSTTIETWRYLARVQSMAGDYLAAEVCLVEALNVSRQQEDKGEYAAALYEKLLLHKKQQQFEAALAVGYECLDLFQKLGSLRLEGLVKTQLGLLHQARQEPHQGLSLLNAGLDIFCELGDLFEQAYSYYYLSHLYAEIGDTAQSHHAKQQARQLNLALNNPRLAERLQ